jgi:hypothetical protein
MARRWAIAAILVVALGLRALAFSPYAVHHADEAFQYIEQAHRLAFGSGLVPWEYRYGMRSWLVPLLLAGPMRLGDLLWPGSILYIVLARAAAAAIALAVLPAAWWLGSRVSRTHGLVAMAVVAVWYESIYFSVHVLTETLSVATFFLAAALLAPGERGRRLVAGGALLALSVVFRFHYAPAAAAFALVLFGPRWRDWGWLALGAALIAVASGTVDLAFGQWPFAWIFENFRENVVENKAADFGSFGPIAYFQMLYIQWQLAFVPILALALLGARRFPALLAAALCNLAMHLLIGHKEYRFILLTTQLLIFLAAIGSVDAVEHIRARWRGAPPVSAMVAVLLALWAAASAALAFDAHANPQWRRFEGGFLMAREAAARRACGVAVTGGNYWATGGQAFLHAATPLYYIRERGAARAFASTAHAYTAVIAPPGYRALPPAYRRVACAGAGEERLCLAMRPGACRRDAVSERARMQRRMEAENR